MDRHTRPLCAVRQHDLEHRHAGWLCAEPKHHGLGKLAVTALLVKQELVTHPYGRVGRIYEEIHVCLKSRHNCVGALSPIFPRRNF